MVILSAWGRRVVNIGKYRISGGFFFFCVCAVGDGGGRCAIGFDCACDHVVVCEQPYRMSTARVHVGWV